jgi:adenylosuccinate lyase
MEILWSEKSKYHHWLQVELAVVEALGETGRLPRKTVRKIIEKADFDIPRIEAIEREVKHDIIAFLTSVAEYVGPDARHIHVGMTSSDVLDSALATLSLKALGLIMLECDRLLAAIKKQALLWKDLPAMGRTHGVHAEPITLGLKFASWHEELKRARRRVAAARANLAFGTISGAVGNYGHLDPDIEARALKRLGLKPEPAPTQVVPRDRHAEAMLALAQLGGTLERFATEIRHLQRTEVREVEEPFSEKQKGSSAMPHKRNPVGCEQVCGMARLLRGNALAALENVPLWHERDISHSSVERVIFPDSTSLAHYMLRRMTGIIDGLRIYPKQVEKNLWLTGGVFFSQRVLLALTDAGMARDTAYRIVQQAAMDFWEGKGNFPALIKKDPRVLKLLTRKKLDAIMDLKLYLKETDTIFNRVFGDK